MRRLTSVLCLVAALLAPAVAHALDPAEAARRVEASLRMPARLAPPPYMDLAVRARRLSPYDRYRDETAVPFGDYGVWRVHAAVRVEVVAYVWPWGGQDHLLFLDNFAWPRVKQGKIDPFPILRSLGLR